MKKILLILTLILSIFAFEPLDIRPGAYRKYMIDANTGEKIDKLGEYDRISELYQNDSFAMFKAQDGKKWFWVDAITGEVKYEVYEKLGPIQVIGSRNLFYAKKDNKWFYVDAVTGDFVGMKVDVIGEIFEIGEKHILRAVDDEKLFFVDMITGQVLIENAQESGIPEYTDSLYVIALRKNDRWAYVNILTDTKIGGDFESVGKVNILDEQPYFQASENKLWFYVDLHTGEHKAGRYQSIALVEGELDEGWAFRALVDGKWYLVRDWEKGIEGPGYESIVIIDQIGDDLLLHYVQGEKRPWTILDNQGQVHGVWDDMDEPICIEQNYYFKAATTVGSRTKYQWVDVANRKNVCDLFFELSDLKQSPYGLIFRAKGPKGWEIRNFQKSLTPAYDFIGDQFIIFRDKHYFTAQDANSAFFIDLETGGIVEQWGRWDDVCCFSVEKAEFRVRKDKKYSIYSIDKNE